MSLGMDRIDPKEIPDGVLRDFRNMVQKYSVALVLADGEGDTSRYACHASGTLVEHDGFLCILTAGHVVEAISQHEWLGVPVAEIRHRPPFFPTGALVSKTLYTGGASQWGPDLALVRLPAGNLGDITARKSFLNVTRRAASVLKSIPDFDRGAWGIVGCPSEISEISGQEGVIVTATYVSYFPSMVEQAPYDYFDHVVNYALAPTLPRDFGGLSGGGMWHVEVGRQSDGSLAWDGELELLGVAFYQLPDKESPLEKAYVRCHGPKSLYGEFLPLVKFQ